ncbi:MAG TPA: ParB N-terminal domain-containing protein, partial [bacterium]|nr:ParB N-terminal domain-containing protein [bacterium]
MSDISQIAKIPISKIIPNEDQPRHRFQAGSIQEMRDSLTALGQLDALKVRPLTEAEKASYTKWELHWHHEFGDPLPDKTLGERGFEYLLIGGHRRLEGARLAGLETLDCIILNIKPEETHLASLMDNNREEMDWWDWDLAIEKERLAFPDMPQRELAKRLGVSKSKVGNALLLAKVMNEESRRMIGNNLDPTLDNDGFPVHLPAEDPDTEDNLAQTLGKTSTSGAPLAQSLGRTKSDYRIT